MPIRVWFTSTRFFAASLHFFLRIFSKVLFPAELTGYVLE